MCQNLDRGEIVTINGDLATAYPNKRPELLEIQHAGTKLLLSWFVMDVVNMVEYGKGVPPLLPTTNLTILKMMEKMLYMHGMELGKNFQGIPEIIDFKGEKATYSLGYRLTAKEVEEDEKITELVR